MARLEPSVNQARVHGQSSAHQRSGVGEAERVRERQDIVSTSQHKLLVTAVPCYPDILAVGAQDFVADDARLTVAAGGKQPQDAYASTGRRIAHAGTEFLDDACDFVARNDRWPHKWKLAIANHQVTVTNAADVDSNKYFVMTGRRHSAFFYLKPSLRFLQNSRSHAQSTSLPFMRVY